MSVISVRDISKAYRLGEVNRRVLWNEIGRAVRRFALGDREEEEEGLFWALKGVSFEIAEGETVGIIGKNGAGKSTILKILSRITAPTAGQATVRGRMASLLEVGTGFHPELTGRDNVYLKGAILGMSRREVKAVFDEILDFCGLEQFIDTPVKRYSSGMYVRLAFSVSVFLEPEILILDEVLAVGDMAFREKCLRRMEKLVRGGHTTLFVSHGMPQILRFCSRVIWLDSGRVRYDGPAEQGCEQYRLAQLAAAALTNAVPNDLSTKERFGDGTYRISRITTLDQAGREGANVQTGSQCTVVIDYAQEKSFPEEVKEVMAGIVVQGEYGDRLLGLPSDILPTNFLPLPSRGRLQCKIPRLPLLPGTYTLTVSLLVNGRLMDKIVSAISFTVEDGDFFGSGKLPNRSMTPLCVDYGWELDRGGRA